MQQKVEKSFEYDEKKQEFNIHIEEENPIIVNGKTYGSSKSVTNQVWTKEGAEELQKMLDKQVEEADKAIETTQAQIKVQGTFTDREVQNLVKFKENLEKVTKLAQKEKLEAQLKNQEEIKAKLLEDVNEVRDGISKSMGDKTEAKEESDGVTEPIEG